MFKRREPLKTHQKMKEMVWPSMGLKRALVYLKHRILRIADSTPKVALGLAIGLGVSFTPLLGTHFIQAGLLSYLFRGNIFAAMLGTFIGNPWTFPFFWWAGFSFGRFLFHSIGFEHVGELPANMNLLEIATQEPMTIFVPWMLGGYVLCVIATPIAYFIYYYIVHFAKIARAKARARRMARRAAIRARAKAK